MEKPTRVETEVIKFLALNPKENTQRIQRGIGLEDKNYPTVRDVLKRLEKKHIVNFSKAKSEKNVLIKFYRLTPRGVFVAFGISSDSELTKILANYKLESDDLILLKQFCNFLSEATGVKILRYAGRLALSHLDFALPELLVTAIASSAMLGLEEFSEKEKKEISEAAAKIDKVKVQLKAMFEYAKKVIFETEDFLNGKGEKKRNS